VVRATSARRPEWQAKAQRWRDMQAIERDASFRSF